MSISPVAGTLPKTEDLIDVARLLRAYDDLQPDPGVPAQRVQFGTSGHRGSSLDASFNRNHILAVTQAVCSYRRKQGITGPLFLGMDTHALSVPAFQTTLEVLAANEVIVQIGQEGEFTPTPAISHAILTYNRGRPQETNSGLADGIVLTPSHNPPREGGYKYNPPHGGPAEKGITDWVQNEANRLLKAGLGEVKKIPYARALAASTTHRHDYIEGYVRDLGAIIDFEVLRGSKLRLGVDPMGGAGVKYWPRIAEDYRIDLTVMNTTVDPTFRFMTRDWDGQIRMDPSSPYAMRSMLDKSKGFDLSFACDTDHDRHGIVTPTEGLMPPNHYLATSIDYLYRNRPRWAPTLKVGKTLVSSQMIDRVAKALSRELYEVPVGFKWFVEGLRAGWLGFGGEESAGASFLRKDGRVWTTDKDALIPALLSAEMTARLGKNPAEIYRGLSDQLGVSHYRRVDAPASTAQKKKLASITASELKLDTLAGEPAEKVLTHAPGNDAPIGGVKVQIASGWFAARPSGTEEIYKIYAESFRGEGHLTQLLKEAQTVVDACLSRS